MAEGDPVFDFRAHEQAAVAVYLGRRDFFEDLAVVVGRIVDESLKRRGIKVHSVQYRAKDPASLGKKAALPSEADPSKPKYERPLEQITDRRIAGKTEIGRLRTVLDRDAAGTNPCAALQIGKLREEGDAGLRAGTCQRRSSAGGRGL